MVEQMESNRIQVYYPLLYHHQIHVLQQTMKPFGIGTLLWMNTRQFDSAQLLFAWTTYLKILHWLIALSNLLRNGFLSLQREHLVPLDFPQDLK